ncbi:MAG: FAD-dependent oxidoreductase [Pirellula sp.]
MTAPTSSCATAAGRVESTLTFSDAAAKEWDAMVIGAGVAGTTNALLLAKKGWRVLLIESKRFPREKVCGGCLNGRAVGMLQQLGVYDALLRAGAIQLTEFHVQHGGLGCWWPIPGLLSVRRSTLDTLLVQRAIDAGVSFLQETSATVSQDANSNSDTLEVFLKASNTAAESLRGQSATALARCVVVACGLSRSAIAHWSDWPSNVSPDARIGVQCIVPLESLQGRNDVWQRDCVGRPEVLHMLVGDTGYVGICRTDEDWIDVAAAIDPENLEGKQGLKERINALIRSCGWTDLPDFPNANWQSTPRLTRTTAIAARDRVYLVGDTLGYVEPFTGEGMSWALAGAFALAPILDGGLRDARWPAAALSWNSWVARHRRGSQTVCRWVAKQARHKRRAQWALRMCDWLPPMRHYLLRKATQ